MLTPSAVGAYFEFVLEQLLEDLAEPCLVTDGGHPLGRSLPADRVRTEDQAQRVDGLADGRNGVEWRPRQPGQPLPADRREDRIDESIEPRHLVQRGVMPLARVGLRWAGTRPGGCLAEEVDVRPDDRQRRAQLMGDDRQELGPRGIERRELLQPALDLGLQPALRDDAREERGDRRQELDLGATEVALRQRLDVEHADDLLVPHERHRQHRVQAAHVEPADPREAAVGGDVAHGDRQAGRGRATGDPLADRQAHPADLAAVQAVRCGERQPIRVPVGQVERADLDAHRRRRPVDDRAHQLVPVACLRREPRDLVEECQLVETAPGGGTWPRRLRDGFGRRHRPIMAHRAGVRGAACARPSRGAGR